MRSGDRLLGQVELGNRQQRRGDGPPLDPPTITVGTVALERITGKPTHFFGLKYHMILEGPDRAALLCQTLLDCTIPLQRRLIITIPLHSVDGKICRQLHYRFNRLADAPRQHEPSFTQRMS